MWAATAKAKIDIPLSGARAYVDGKFKDDVDIVIKAGEEITITNGVKERYCLWGSCIWDLPEEYVGEIVRIISEQ